MAIYFAYGSNLKTTRMVARVPSARALGAAHLPGHGLTFDKRGRDGSGKANLVSAPDQRVWGVLYRIDESHWADLDAHEPGYQRVPVRVVRHAGEWAAAQTYLAVELADEGVARDWYLRVVVEGAREHDLPADWIAHLEAFPFTVDGR